MSISGAVGSFYLASSSSVRKRVTQVSPRNPARGTRWSVENLKPSSTTLEGRFLPASQASHPRKMPSRVNASCLWTARMQQHAIRPSTGLHGDCSAARRYLAAACHPCRALPALAGRFLAHLCLPRDPCLHQARACEAVHRTSRAPCPQAHLLIPDYVVTKASHKHAQSRAVAVPARPTDCRAEMAAGRAFPVAKQTRTP